MPPSKRLEVVKTYKLFINGAFPRSESGRSLPVTDSRGVVLAHISHASRKDLRDAVEAARAAQRKWADATAYNRGQVLYRMAEMLEGRKAEFVEALEATARRSGGATRGNGKKATSAARGAEGEVLAAIDRLVCFGGWADKYAQVLGCNNPVAGPYYNFTVPEPTGVVAVVAPDECPLLALISLLAPPLCAGNAVVALASEASPLPGAVLGEVCATSDIPPGIVNLLTGKRAELLPHFSSHRDIDAISGANLSAEESRLLREGTAENLKRVAAPGSVDWFDEPARDGPWCIEPFVEMKTIWHPSAT